jgi:hypothetical protein
MSFWIWKDVFARGWPGLDPTIQRTMTLNSVGGHVHARGEHCGFWIGIFRAGERPCMWMAW